MKMGSMRAIVLAAVAALLGLPLAGCYNPQLFKPDGTGGFFCHSDDNPACPDGTMCVVMPAGGTMGRCMPPAGGMMGGGPVQIPKTGSYTGPQNDPMLATLMSCPDSSLEPNDDPASAISAPNPVPDMTTPKITKMAICPTGPNPATGLHDVDFFKISGKMLPSGTLTLKANVFYDVSYGDLDVAILDSTGSMLASDGSSVSNGCVAASIQGGSGDYYVVVVGANNKDVNRYDIRIASFSTAQTCAPPSGTDGGV
ncbi:MAG: hypothetical protein ACHQ17_05985 [Polyangia bacterium]|jgi:hypothetical protein